MVWEFLCVISRGERAEWRNQGLHPLHPAVFCVDDAESGVWEKRHFQVWSKGETPPPPQGADPGVEKERIRLKTDFLLVGQPRNT